MELRHWVLQWLCLWPLFNPIILDKRLYIIICIHIPPCNLQTVCSCLLSPSSISMISPVLAGKIKSSSSSSEKQPSESSSSSEYSPYISVSSFVDFELFGRTPSLSASQPLLLKVMVTHGWVKAGTLLLARNSIWRTRYVNLVHNLIYEWWSSRTSSATHYSRTSFMTDVWSQSHFTAFW